MLTAEQDEKRVISARPPLVCFALSGKRVRIFRCPTKDPPQPSEDSMMPSDGDDDPVMMNSLKHVSTLTTLDTSVATKLVAVQDSLLVAATGGRPGRPGVQTSSYHLIDPFLGKNVAPPAERHVLQRPRGTRLSDNAYHGFQARLLGGDSLALAFLSAYSEQDEGRRVGTSLLFSGGRKSKVIVWDHETGDLVHTFTDADRNTWSIAASRLGSGGASLFCGGYDHPCKIRHHDLEKLATVGYFIGHGGSVYGLHTFDGKETSLYSASHDNTVRVWSKKDCRETCSMQTWPGAMSVEAFPDRHRVAVGLTNGNVRIFDLRKPSESVASISIHPFTRRHTAGENVVWDLHRIRGSDLLLSSASRKVGLCDVVRGKILGRKVVVGEQETIRSMCVVDPEDPRLCGGLAGEVDEFEERLAVLLAHDAIWVRVGGEGNALLPLSFLETSRIRVQ